MTLLLPSFVMAQKARKDDKQQHKKDSLSIYAVWGLSTVLPGSGQFINKQYYKIPIFYAGIGAFAYMGYKSNQRYHESYAKYKLATSPLGQSPSGNINFDDISTGLLYKNNLVDVENNYIKNKQLRNISYTTAGAIYLLSIADALVNFDDNKDHSPAKATILSAIFPGLGQMYNHKYWKIPILYGGFAGLGYGISFNSREYKRFKTAYNLLTDKNPDTVDEFNGARSADELKSARDYYRRNRDYTIIGTAALYVLNIVDAHVDATLFDYDISDNLSVRIEPTFINDNYLYAQGSDPYQMGMRLTLNF